MRKMLNVLLVVSLLSSQAIAAPTNIEQSVDAAISELPKAPQKTIAENPEYRKRLIEYMERLKLVDDRSLEELLLRLTKSTTQFLLCDAADWVCLEKKPLVLPAAAHRIDAADDLGKPVVVKEPLKMQTFFTKRWAQRKRGQPTNDPTMAQIFGNLIRQNAQKGLYLAIYGIDDIENSMKPVFEAIAEKVAQKVETKAVFDVTSEGAPNSFFRDYDFFVGKSGFEIIKYEKSAFDFSYTRPQNTEFWAFGRPTWMDQVQGMDPAPFAAPKKIKGQLAKPPRRENESLLNDVGWVIKMPGGKTATRLAFQYKGTPALLQLMNSGISKNEQAPARIEYPMDGIMHNKFAVMKKNDGKMSLWSGTTNVAQTCMGDEDNSNLALFIENTEIAKTFLEEFEEMHAYDKTNAKVVKEIPSLVTGRFHKQKRPNTKRYFQFSDGHEVRVHFSPTDDGEHRSVIPMIWSAKTGDHLRISMFGSGGIEGVRALQAAAARGVKIQIVLDNTTGSQNSSWLKDSEGNLMEPNVYDPNATDNIEVRLNNWAGLNHQKAATLTRANGRVETLIVGSQNWSMAGNDVSDENMLTIRHLKQNVGGGLAFNKDFDEAMFPLSLKIRLTAAGKIEKFGGEVDASLPKKDPDTALGDDDRGDVEDEQDDEEDDSKTASATTH